ncbi:MAG: hypothetical protein P8H92_10590 [Paracoccaceae bacterium]|nr:hypothetical protein [Paracoccaceae bacterium]MDG1738394.1 hypothetical protein [Paracoccaceae bacterium]
MAIGGTGKVESGLGGQIGYGEVMVPRSDDGSYALDVSGVFRDGLQIFDQGFQTPIVYINTNGTLSFGAAVSPYPTRDLTFDAPILAPFWGDVDTRLDGEGFESGAIWADLDTNNGVFTVTWYHVGVYRRSAELTNVFQLQLYDQGGGDFDFAFRYDQIEWEIGTSNDDNGAIAGIFDPLGNDLQIGSSNMLELGDVAGNSGEVGLWTFSVRNGEIRDYSSQNVPIYGSTSAEELNGSGSADHILSYDGDDTLSAGDGSDTVDAGAGDDFVFGGTGNDELYGRDGDDNILGGFGADRIFGDDGQDILTGSAREDVLLGGNGDDFLNGGWGHDRLTGGEGADRFYHEGVTDHGSDWVTDFYSPEGDVLTFGGIATESDFLVQYAETPGAGEAGVKEAFVTYIPTGQIIWAIEDGELDELRIALNGEVFDLA